MPQNKMSMNNENIIECINSIKVKNNEGFDRIPNIILVDGIDPLVSPFTELFRLIYHSTQWKITIVVPLQSKVLQTKLKIARLFQICAQYQKS